MRVSFNPSPKPTSEQVSAFMNSGARKGLMRRTPLKADPVKARAWQDRSRQKSALSLARNRKPMKQFNPARQRRKRLNYNAVIRSDFNKKLRYDAFIRSSGLCECAKCVEIRALGDASMTIRSLYPDAARAWEAIPIWFERRGGDMHRRFRSNDGELHHDSYMYFGDENPAELEVVRFVWVECHRRIEAEFGTRRRFLARLAA